MKSRTEKPSLMSAIESSSLLGALPEDVRRTLAERSTMSYVDRGEVIWMHGAKVDYFGLVASGFVKIVKTTETGAEVTSELMGPGQIFGMLGVIEGTGCPSMARGVTETWYVKIPTRLFMEYYNSMATLKDQIILRTTTRLRHAYDSLTRMSTARVDVRIAAVLLIIADSYGRDTAEGLSIEVPLSRQDIAEMAGTTVETTIRTMSRWQKAGVVSTTHKHIVICKPDVLGDFLHR